MGARQDRIDLIFLARGGEQHVQEVLGIPQLVFRVRVGLAEVVLVRQCRNGRHLGDHAVRRNHAVLRIADIERVVIERRQGADHTAHHRHRVGIAAEPAQEGLHLFVNHRVIGDVMLELFLVGSRRQVPVQKQVADLHEVGVLG